jgi:hypothetical protein
MILAFNPRFMQPILEGTKIHTIREDKKERWRPGMSIQMATGVRSPKYFCFMNSVCTDVQKIEIIPGNSTEGLVSIPSIIIDRDELSVVGIDKLFGNDGFKTLLDFCNWFDKPFTGRLIHWTNFKY